jgi:hypothetical protein
MSQTKDIRQQKGSALALVIIIFAVLSVLGASVLFVSVNDTRQVMRQQQKIQSFYVARAGADAFASKVIQNPNAFADMRVKTETAPATGQIAGQDFQVKVTGNISQFIIESAAIRDGQEDAKLYLLMNEFNLLDFSIFADQILTTGNNLDIQGNIGTNLNTIQYGNEKIDGTITLGPSASLSDLATAKSKTEDGLDAQQLTQLLSFPQVAPDDFGDDEPASEFEPEEDIDDSGVYIYEVSDGDKDYRWVDSIDLGGNDSLTITGGGELHLFLSDETISKPIAISGNANIGTDDNSKLFIYYNGNKTIQFNGQADSHVYFYAPAATITLLGGGSGNLYGSFICKTFNGPSSTVDLIQDENMTMDNLLLPEDTVVGYNRTAWSDVPFGE